MWHLACVLVLFYPIYIHCFFDEDVIWDNITLPNLPYSIIVNGITSIVDEWKEFVSDASGRNLVVYSRSHIFYSVDAGLSWDQSLGFDPNTTFWVDISSHDSGTVYAAALYDFTGYSCIFVSYDYGMTFELNWRTASNFTSYHQVFTVNAWEYVYGLSTFYQGTYPGVITKRDSLDIYNATSVWTPTFGGYRAMTVSGDGSVLYYATYIFSSTSEEEEGYIFSYFEDWSVFTYYRYVEYTPNLLVCDGDGQHAIGAHSSTGTLVISNDFGEGFSWEVVQFPSYYWRTITNDRTGVLLFAIVTDQDDDETKLLYSSNHGYTWSSWAWNEQFFQLGIQTNSQVLVSYTGKLVYVFPNMSSNVIFRGINNACPPGHEINSTNQCESCTVGKYLGANDTSCHWCLPGTYNNRRGSTDCFNCPLGHIAASYGMTQCLACPVGSMSTDAINCSYCPLGSYSDEEASSECSQCPVGSYGIAEGKNQSEACASCPQGSYSPLEGQTYCLSEFELFVNASVPDYRWVNYTADIWFSWKKLTVDDSGLNFAAINDTHILYSNDGGMHWSVSTGYLIGTVIWYDIAYDNSGAIYAFFQSETQAISGFYASYSRGLTFSISRHWSHLDVEVKQLIPVYNTDDWYYVNIFSHNLNGSHRSYLRRVESEGSDVTVLRGYTNETFLAAAVADENDLAFVSTVFRSDVSFARAGTGELWTMQTDTGTGSGINAATPLDMIVCSFDGRQAVAVASRAGFIRYNGNYGQTEDWELVITPYVWNSIVMDRAGSLVMAMVRDPLHGNATKLLSSYDGGITWSNVHRASVALSSTTIMHISPVSRSIVLISDINRQVFVGHTDACPPGSVLLEVNGQTSCLQCPPGSAASKWNSTSCVQCLAGSYSSKNGTSTCISCPPGRYSSVNGSASCLQCPVGTISTNMIGSVDCTNCSLGFYSDDPGSYQCPSCPTGRYGSTPGKNISSGCALCPSGTYTPTEGLLQCLPCEAGSFQAIRGQSQCTQCPLNSYIDNAGGAECYKCPSGQLTNAIGQTTASSCFSPYPNIVAGIISAILSFVVAFVYIFNGEVHRLAELRESALVSKLSQLCLSVNEYVEGIITKHQTDRELQRLTALTAGQIELRWKRLLKGCAFWLIAILFMLVGTISLYIRFVTNMLFMSMIVFRGVKVTIPFAEVVNASVHHLFLQREWLLVFYRPFVWVLDQVARVKLTFQNVNVTCAGIQGPIQLLFNCVALVATVFVIAAKYQYFWSQYLSPLPGAVMKMFFMARKYRSIGFLGFLKLVGVNGLMWLLCVLNPFQRGLMYLMSLTTIYLFVEKQGLHESTPGCDSQPGVRNLDFSLAILSSILAYLVLQPAIYTIAVVLVPYLPPWCRLESHQLTSSKTVTVHPAESEKAGDDKEELKPQVVSSSQFEPGNYGAGAGAGAALVIRSLFRTMCGRSMQLLYRKWSTYLSLDLIMLEVSRAAVRALRKVLDSCAEPAALKSTNSKDAESLSLEGDVIDGSDLLRNRNEAPMADRDGDDPVQDAECSTKVGAESDAPQVMASTDIENFDVAEVKRVHHDMLGVHEPPMKFIAKHDDKSGIETASVWAILLANVSSDDPKQSANVQPSAEQLDPTEHAGVSQGDLNKNKPRTLPTFAELSVASYRELCMIFYDIDFPTEAGRFAGLRDKGSVSRSQLITFNAFIWLFYATMYFGLAVYMVFVVVVVLVFCFVQVFNYRKPCLERQSYARLYIYPALWLYLVIYPVYFTGTFTLYVMSFTIFGHLSTRLGRQCWYIVAYNYWVFSLVSLGIWFDDFALVMGVHSSHSCAPSLARNVTRFQRCGQLMWQYYTQALNQFGWQQPTALSTTEYASVREAAKSDMEAGVELPVVEKSGVADSAKVSPQPEDVEKASRVSAGSDVHVGVIGTNPIDILDKKIDEDDADETAKATTDKGEDDADYDTDALSALIGIRAVLFQLSQNAAPASVLIASWCATPLFVFTKEVHVPPMLATSAWKHAVAEVAAETGFQWTIPLLTLRNLVSDSRLIQFVLNAYPALTATLLILLGAASAAEGEAEQDPAEVLSWVVAGYMCLTVTVSAIQSLDYIVYVGRFMDITDEYFWVWSWQCDCSKTLSRCKNS